MSMHNLKTIKERRNFISKKMGVSLDAISVYPQQLESAQAGNCENMIGAISLPVGIAGPLSIHGQFAQGEYYIPLATTEAALVASVNRGCKAITVSGGAQVFSELIGATRGCIFQTNNLSKSMNVKYWIEANSEKLKEVAKFTSSHLKLLDILIQVVGINVYARFSYDTSDAMGMNMVTIATHEVGRFIEKELGVSMLALAGNFDIDKKPAWLNFILGRGRKIWAEAILEEKYIREILKTTSTAIHQVTQEKCLKGSALSGSLGFNCHFANIIAAIFSATGQDIAHTVEGSLGVTATEIVDGKLAISVMLPDILVGTIGGGTGLPAQKEMLTLLGVKMKKPGDSASLLGEVVGACVLAGELSLLAAISAGHLSSSHKRLRRKKNNI